MGIFSTRARTQARSLLGVVVPCQTALGTISKVRNSTWCQLAIALAVCTLSLQARADGLDYHEDVAAPVVPAWFSMPAEVGNAAAWTRDGSGPVYQFRFGVLPGILWGPLSLHAVLQGVYRNPDWDVGLGIRPTLRLGSLLGGFVPVRLLAEASYLPITRGSYVAGGFSVGLGSLVYVGGLFGRDLDRGFNFAGLRLGIEVTSLGDPIGAVIRDVPQTGAPPPTPAGP